MYLVIKPIIREIRCTVHVYAFDVKLKDNSAYILPMIACLVITCMFSLLSGYYVLFIVWLLCFPYCLVIMVYIYIMFSLLSGYYGILCFPYCLVIMVYYVFLIVWLLCFPYCLVIMFYLLSGYYVLLIVWLLCFPCLPKFIVLMAAEWQGYTV